MARGPHWPKFALEGLSDRYPVTPVPSELLRDLDPNRRGPPLVDIGPLEGTTLQQLQRDQDLVRRVVDLLPEDQVRAGVEVFARHGEALTEALGGKQMVAAVLDQLDGALSREEAALLHTELEHELGGPLDDETSEDSWVAQEAEHARWEVARHWIAQILAAVHQHGPISLDACLRPVQPPGTRGEGSEWKTSPEEVEEALLASVALKRESIELLMKSLHDHLTGAITRSGPFELPGRVMVSRQADGSLQAGAPR